jgi:hypothetical protein
MVLYHIMLMQRDAIGSSYVNRMCSDMYIDRAKCVAEIRRRMEGWHCLTKKFVDSDEQWDALEAGDLFFSVGVVNVVE